MLRALSLCAALGLAACSNSTSPSGSQDLTGSWVGTASQPGGPLAQSFTYKMDLKQHGDQVTGTSHSEAPSQPQYYADAAVTGTLDATTSIFHFTESISNQVAPPNQFWCVKTGDLQFSSNPRRLTGSWTATGCAPGMIDLTGQ